MAGALVAALGVALFGLGAIPAEEASAARIVGGLHYISPATTADTSAGAKRTYGG